MNASVITGTTQGLGAELVKLFAGSELIVINRRPSGVKPEIICDLSIKANVDKAALELSTKLADKKEVLFILNAAAYGDDETVSDVDPQALGKLVYTNVFSQLSLVESLLLRGLKVKLVAISSAMGSVSLVPEPYHFAYSISKAGLNLSVRLMKVQYKNQLDYLLINPGWMPTQMGGSEAPDDPKIVAANVHQAISNDHNWNDAKGMLEVNTKDVHPW